MVDCCRFFLLKTLRCRIFKLLCWEDRLYGYDGLSGFDTDFFMVCGIKSLSVSKDFLFSSPFMKAKFRVFLIFLD